LLVLEARGEPELIAVGVAPRGHIVAGRYVYLIEHIVIEVVLVGADAGFLEGIDAERRDQHLRAVVILDERVHVRRIGRIVERDERRVHVTGSPRPMRREHEARDCERAREPSARCLHDHSLLRVGLDQLASTNLRGPASHERTGSPGRFGREQHLSERQRLLQPVTRSRPILYGRGNDAGVIEEPRVRRPQPKSLLHDLVRLARPPARGQGPREGVEREGIAACLTLASREGQGVIDALASAGEIEGERSRIGRGARPLDRRLDRTCLVRPASRTQCFGQGPLVLG
jgi:hypothetical protein